MELYQVVLLVVSAIVAILYFIQRLTGVNYIQIIVQWKPVQAAITALVKAVENILPSPYFKTVVTVLEAAGKGAETAEELWKLGELSKDERNRFAKELAADVLSNAGIDVTPQIQMIIDGAIEIVCMLMPHGVVPDYETVDPQTESEDDSDC